MGATSQEVTELVRRGVALYQAGQFRDAIDEWERALALDPQQQSAREYLAFVRENYDRLRQSFDRGERIPLGVGDDVSRATREFGSGSLGHLLGRPTEDLLDLAPLGSGPQPHSEVNEDAETMQRRHPLDFSDMALVGDSVDETEPDTEERRPIDMASFDLGEIGEVTVDERPGDDEQLRSSSELAGSGQIDLGWELNDDFSLGASTSAGPGRSGKPGSGFLDQPPETKNIRPPSEGGSRPTTEVVVNTRGGPVSPVEAIKLEISEQVGEVRPGQPEDHEVRRRVSGLLERAFEESERNRGQLAVVAAILALDESPKSALAQKLVHEQIDRIQGIFSSYLESPELVPLLAKPLAELTGIDSREAFLLSQVDGLLSFSDIIDVSGMTTLEACVTLCRLLIDGIITIH